MREYIIAVAGAALLSVFADIISPEKWRKYIKIITGIVIISVIIAPVAAFKGIDMPEMFDIDEDITIGDTDRSRAVADEFRRLIEDDIKERIYADYGIECEVNADIKLNADMQIEKVERVKIFAGNPPDGMKEMLMYIYGLSDKEIEIYD